MAARLMGTTYGGTYEPIPDERGYVGSKVGGQLTLEIPDGIPNCRGCGKPMRFLLQLDLGSNYEPYRMAVVLICSDPINGQCGTGTVDGGVSVVLLKELVSTEPLGPKPGEGEWPAKVSPPHSVTWTRWEDFARMPEFGVDDSEFGLLEDAKLIAFNDRFNMTKLGGWPLYIENDTVEPPCPACGGETTFVAQFDAQLGGENPDGSKRCLDEFGDCGVGYLFLCDARCSELGGAFVVASFRGYPVRASFLARNPQPPATFLHPFRMLSPSLRYGEQSGSFRLHRDDPLIATCGGRTIFEAQFDSVLGKSLSGEDVIVNFGDVGAGYVFLCENRCSNSGGACVWQCS